MQQAIGASAAPQAADPLGWLQVSGASAGEVAQIRQLVDSASASPSARKLFSEFAQRGLQVVVHDDASDPEFASDPNTVAYESGGVVHLRRSELAQSVTGQRLLNALLHESIHAADDMNASRIQPAVSQIRATLGAGAGQAQLDAELTAMYEARAFVGADNMMRELGLGDARTGGFGLTGQRIGAVAAQLVQSGSSYSNGVTNVVASSLSDAVLGNALLG